MPFPLRLVKVDGTDDGDKGDDGAVVEAYSCSTVLIDWPLPLVVRSDIASASLPRRHSPFNLRSMMVMSFMISSSTAFVSFRHVS